MNEKQNAATLSISRCILNQLRDCTRINWQWTEAKTLTLTFTWEGFAGGEGHDIIFCLRGVTQVIFDCPADRESGFSIHEATLRRESIKGSGAIRYRLELEGDIMLEVACQTCEVFTQARLDDAELETAEVDDVTLADVKKAFAELDGAFAELEVSRADHEREMAALQAETRASLRKSDEITKEWQRS